MHEQVRELRRCLADGATLRVQGRYREAEPLLLHAVTLAAAAFGEDHHETGAALNRLGMLYRYAGDATRAREAYERAMNIAVSQFGAESDEVATVWHNLSGLHYSIGALVEAEHAARRAIEI